MYINFFNRLNALRLSFVNDLLKVTLIVSTLCSSVRKIKTAIIVGVLY